MDRIDLSNFTGGVVNGDHPRDFVEGQWAEVFGLTLRRDQRLRTQGQVAEQRADGSAVVTLFAPAPDGGLLEVTDSPSYSARVIPIEEGGFGTPGPELTGAPTPSASYRIATFHASGVASGSDPSGTDALTILYPGPGSSAVYLTSAASGFTSLASRRPTAATADAFPYGQVSCSWGDYLVLGSIYWMDDPAAAYDGTNEAFYGNGLWYSQPGKPLRWDPIDVEFLPFADADEEIAVLAAAPFGLVAAGTRGNVWLLRGTPNNHSIERLSRTFPVAGVDDPPSTTGLLSRSQPGVYWPEIDRVVFGDRSGRLVMVGEQSITYADVPVEPGAWRADGMVAYGGRLYVAMTDETAQQQTRLFEVTASERGAPSFFELDIHPSGLASGVEGFGVQAAFATAYGPLFVQGNTEATA